MDGPIRYRTELHWSTTDQSTRSSSKFRCRTRKYKVQREKGERVKKPLIFHRLNSFIIISRSFTHSPFSLCTPQFVGLASFFRDHIRDFSRISGYLTALTLKTSDWKCGELPNNALEAFRRLQELLINEPIISYARNDLPFRLYCDASMGTTEKNGHKISGGLGAVLTQIHEGKNERVVGYASRKLKTHEENYPAYLLEMLAVTFGCEHFHHYLYGQRKFIMYSDHLPLSKLNKVHVKTQGRLQEMLLEYNYEIVYRKGEDQEAADFLSRNAVEALDTGSRVNFEESNELFNFQIIPRRKLRSYNQTTTYVRISRILSTTTPPGSIPKDLGK